MQRQVVGHRTTQARSDLARALRHNAKVFAAQLDLAQSGDPKAIHRARVATRRLREALAVAAGVLGGDAEALRKEFRTITSALGPVRELDVSRRLLREIADDAAWPTDAVDRVEQRFAVERSTALERLHHVLGHSDTQALAERVRAVARDVKEIEPAKLMATVSTRYARRSREFARTLQEAGTVFAGDRLHRVRIAAKKLRYLLELGDSSNSDALRRLKRLQKFLGNVHDAQMVQQQIDTTAASESVVGLYRALRAMSRDVEAEGRAWHGKALPLMLAPGTSRRPARMAGASRRKRSA